MTSHLSNLVGVASLEAFVELHSSERWCSSSEDFPVRLGPYPFLPSPSLLSSFFFRGRSLLAHGSRALTEWDYFPPPSMVQSSP